ncbi:Hpr(Ser) kinase/phosphatase [Paenisporosarcina quisquiliarum]|uniref:HPr(Ser) kinase/phosphatase n=1 Tax=Psychrobacillus psychrodurans TaxID=126157 RepID=A0A9X3R8T7_9BACI|nr:HPr(Ser) kinase/phosphatase [Psychrobacillus psychrodurans]MCZ8532845.1 HPr(Ser) kinase/phosphatase [Psychrobacillus psychrodurans]MCZ8539474.1 HPr(Ser) kinase/phosphatase [Psychrobacillus psychrodurans]SEM23745.1 Hpr(Ser) kinase/phosphatase [Paenisporosarcina quisquiliarum]SFM39698.1 HPr kinase/phosphorylase [Psychrobacillus psychrodurans]
MKNLMVTDLVNRFSLEVLSGHDQCHRVLKKTKVRRPGLEFMDKFDFIATEHVQILGKNEISYLHTLQEEECKLRIGNIIKYDPPCIIITSNQEEPPGLIQYCVENEIPLLRTFDSTSEVSAKLDAFVVKAMAPEISIHGVCVNVSGMGILLRGKSGVGKSETAHTLIGRGHRLVADDIVVLKKLSPQTLLGSHNEKNKEFLALRSIGLLNVVRLYGRTAFQEETRIALDIELTKWESNTLNNELELETKFIDYMGVQIPHIQIQLQPGRDVAGLIEAAANNWYLKQQGYSAAEEFVKRLEQEMED